jgi:hypothetical protein
MRRPTLNFIVDAAAFAAFLFLTATGVLVRYVLPPGSGHFTTLWGMDRHGWGQIHFWIAVSLLAILGLHLFLHWRWVVTVVRGRPREGSGVRLGLATIGLLALLALAATPFLGRVERTGEGPPHRGSAPDDPHPIDGSMTLHQVEEQTGVSPAEVLRDLGLPPDLPTDVNLGKLRKIHGFEMHEVREVVRKRLEER